MAGPQVFPITLELRGWSPWPPLYRSVSWRCWFSRENSPTPTEQSRDQTELALKAQTWQKETKHKGKPALALGLRPGHGPPPNASPLDSRFECQRAHECRTQSSSLPWAKSHHPACFLCWNIWPFQQDSTLCEAYDTLMKEIVKVWLSLKNKLVHIDAYSKKIL